MNDPRYDSVMGNGPKRIAQIEKISCPDAETLLTGIDYYDHPRLCRERMNQLYPHLHMPVPTTEIKPHPYGIELGVLIKMLKETSRALSVFL